MPSFSEQINKDFLKEYRALDAIFAANGGVQGYLSAMEGVSWQQTRALPFFSRELDALKRCRTLYLRLTKTANLAESLASEDDIDYLRDLISRSEEKRDPLSRLADEAPDKNNADAKKDLPIESSAREISSHSIVWQDKLKKLALTSAACLAVGLSIVWRIKKGLNL